MRTFFRINNIFLLLALIGCCAGAIAGLIVLLPFVAGAWALNLVGLLGFEEAARTESPRAPAAEAAPAANRRAAAPEPATRQAA